MAPSPLDKHPAGYKSPRDWLVRLGMDLRSCFVCYVELKLAPTDAIWLFSVQTYLELGNIMILSIIVILKCHDNRNRREIFNIVISPIQYYRKYRDYQKIHCSETFISVNYFQLIFTILVPIALLSDIVIISIIVIITLMIYRDMKFLLSPIPRRTFNPPLRGSPSPPPSTPIGVLVVLV